MLKGKKATYILLSVIVLIWAIIGYRYFTHFSDQPTRELSFETTYKVPSSKQNESFDLLPTLKDPFLGTTRSTPSMTTKTTPKKVLTNFPQVAYKGMLESGKGKAKVFLIDINGQQHLMTIGEEMQGVKLLSATNQKVVVQFEGTSKEISL
mgnify:CR=1 FL=1|tara:strand:- start:411987 stop:412439 length:453 start_codon:yes stop_codon:yes gene_type:complete